MPYTLNPNRLGFQFSPTLEPKSGAPGSRVEKLMELFLEVP